MKQNRKIPPDMIDPRLAGDRKPNMASPKAKKKVYFMHLSAATKGNIAADCQKIAAVDAIDEHGD